MLFFSILSFRRVSKYYIKTNISKRTDCTNDSPCSFNEIIQKVNPGDQIYLKDRLIDNKKDLIQFSTCACTLLNLSVKLIGNDTLIDGAKLPPSDNFFIFSRSEFSGLANFTFTNFRMPILNFNGAQNGTLANISFINNHLKNSYMIVLITCSAVSASNISFIGNVVNDAMVLSLTTVQVFGTGFRFERNCAMHSSSVPLLYGSNAIILVNDFNISNNNMVDGPMAHFNGRNCIFLRNSFLTENHHPEFFVFDGITNISIENSVIEGNTGVFLEATQILFINLLNTTIRNNFSPSDPFFYIPSGIFTAINNSKIINNFGKGFLEFGEEKEVNNSIVLKNSIIENNSYDDEMFLMRGEGSFTSFKTSFINLFSKTSLFKAKEAEILLDSCNVNNCNCNFITTNNRTVYMSNNSFPSSDREMVKGDSLVYKEGSYETLKNETSNEALRRGFVQADEKSEYEEYSFAFRPVFYDKDEFEVKARMDPQLAHELEKQKNLNNDPMRFIDEYNLTEKK